MICEKFIFFVLGGPGAGKGTACLNLQNKHPQSIAHFSTGDLLRKCAKEFENKDENDPDYKICQTISQCIEQGLIVPAAITIKLLMNEIQKCSQKLILVDGFPRNQENYTNWVEINKEYPQLKVQKLLYFHCQYEVLWNRIRKRAEQSMVIRADDNEDVFRKRLQVLESETQEIFEEFRKNNKLITIDSSKSMEEVQQAVFNELEMEKQ